MQERMSKLVAATKGSNAMKLQPAYQDRYAEAAERIAREQFEKERRQLLAEQAKRRQRAKSAQRLKLRIMIVAIICLAFAVMSAIVVGYSKIASLTLEAGKLKNELRANETEIETLELDITMATDLQHIKEVAAEELDMGYPKDYQVFSVTLDENSNDVAAKAESDNDSADALKGLID